MASPGLVDDSTTAAERTAAAEPRVTLAPIVAASERRERVRLQDHAVMGGVMFLALNVLLGFPTSLAPTRLLVTLLASVAFGAPAGYLVGRHGLGPLGAALITSGFLTLTVLVGQMVGFLTGTPVSSGTGTIVWSLAAGALPGLLMGTHGRHGR